jgi:thiamine-phosphate pyrophosphorylase
VETVAAALAGGVRAVVLREKDLSPGRRRALGLPLASLLAAVGGKLIVASDPALAADLGAVAVHLAEADTWPAPDAQMAVGCSCHDAGSLRRAVAAGAAYATLSPVFASRSKPGYGPALGLAELMSCIRAVAGLPVYALGGVDASTAGACLGAGAAGVAVMGAVMAADQPETVARRLMAALHTVPG